MLLLLLIFSQPIDKNSVAIVYFILGHIELILIDALINFVAVSRDIL